jgi:phosphoribosyl 1,2-cyclic phosphate phosphodiesterase
MSLRITILGCGSSGGVPRIGGGWGKCDPMNPRNRRRRCAILVERRGPEGRTAVLVDTPPDLREQLLDVRLDALDGVLYTHDHADHTHGIDDLRMVAYAMKRRIRCHMDAATKAVLVPRFAYCFEAQPGSSYPPILEAAEMAPGEPVVVHGYGGAIEALPIAQEHGDIGSLGFRFGGIAYSPDISGFVDGSERHLKGLDLWIVDALRPEPHPSHFHLKRALDWIERLAPKRALLTHMTAELDYDTLRRDLPSHVEPAYDGMVIELATPPRASTAHLR